MTVERVNYFSGERLSAADLRLDQDYHITSRRLVNRGFFSPGVVEGLTVTKSKPDPTTFVTVAAGFALDPQGREIVLTQDSSIAVPNHLPGPRALGFYLTIRYGEVTLAGPGADCAPDGGSPSRIQELPELAWNEVWPDHARCSGGSGSVSPECAIVLALVTLTASCNVDNIDTTGREQAHGTLPGQIKSFQIEGEKDIAPDNPKRIHFNIRGGTASSVILQLWSDRFSSLFYTELARHHHSVLLGTADENATPKRTGSTDDDVSDDAVTGGPKNINFDHTHAIDTINTGDPPSGITHNHLLTLSPADHGVNDHSGLWWHDDDPLTHVATDLLIKKADLPAHQHSVPGQDTQGSSPNLLTHHKHALFDTSSEDAGNAVDPGRPVLARDGLAEYTYIDSLSVKLDGVPITSLFIKPTWIPKQLGDGTATHGFVNDTDGTGPVRLPNVAPGAHTIDLVVGSTPNGGKVMWNLTVE